MTSSIWRTLFCLTILGTTFGTDNFQLCKWDEVARHLYLGDILATTSANISATQARALIDYQERHLLKSPHGSNKAELYNSYQTLSRDLTTGQVTNADIANPQGSFWENDAVKHWLAPKLPRSPNEIIYRAKRSRSRSRSRLSKDASRFGFNSGSRSQERTLRRPSAYMQSLQRHSALLGRSHSRESKLPARQLSAAQARPRVASFRISDELLPLSSTRKPQTGKPRRMTTPQKSKALSASASTSSGSLERAQKSDITASRYWRKLQAFNKRRIAKPEIQRKTTVEPATRQSFNGRTTFAISTRMTTIEVPTTKAIARVTESVSDDSDEFLEEFTSKKPPYHSLPLLRDYEPADGVNYLFGPKPSRLLEHFLGRVLPPEVKLGNEFLSPRLLSPMLLDDRKEPTTPAPDAIAEVTNPRPPEVLSPALFSIYNRSNALLKLPELFKENSALYNVTAQVLLDVATNERYAKLLRNSAAQSETSFLQGSDGFSHAIDESSQIDQSAIEEKKKIHWLWFEPTNITDDTVDKLTTFHKEWKSNATLRRQWRQWYKENRNLTDEQLNTLMQLNSTRPFDEVLRDAIINAPYILDPVAASSPSVLAPLIQSPYILSPYIFGPFIVSPLILTPQILSPSILAPSVLAPYVLAPLILSPQALNPAILSPFVLSPLILSPAVLSPSILSPVVLNPCILSPFVLGPVILSPGVLAPTILCPSVLPDFSVEQPVLSPCGGC